MSLTASPPPAPAIGLTSARAEEILAHRAPSAPSDTRSYRSIVGTNVFTVFNAILAAFGILTLALGEPQDALFLGIVVANASIGIGQEIRAKHALDYLSALVAPHATVIRDGSPHRLAAGEVVAGDLVTFGAGDQVVADGRLASVVGLHLDESPLTGESEPIAREDNDQVLSGSFAIEGSGSYVVTAAGPDSFAAHIVGQAKAPRQIRSPLELALNRLLLVLLAAMVPLSLVLAASLVLRDTSIADAVPKATAAMVSLVPEGLILLASLTFAVAAARMAARGALAQRLNAIESLAAVDVLCMDKTGTLTEATLRVVALQPAPGIAEEEVRVALGRFAASVSQRNLTLDAIAARFPGTAVPKTQEIPFLSRRRWSAFGTNESSLVFGAPELLLGDALAADAATEAARGRRVVAIAEGEALEDHDPESGPPVTRALGYVAIAEQLRGDASATVEFLRSQGVELRVLSGDNPSTVAAIAADAGIDVGPGGFDGRQLPAGEEELYALLRERTVIGRVSPDDKRRIVQALADQGRYVGFIGDGVNDVPALKAARLSIAQGSGAQMAKSVADVVLVSGDFSAIPQMVHEGRQILRNVQRMAKLFVTKSALAALLILTVGTTSYAYPFLPRHLTIASTFGVGIPAFFLALAPSSGPWRSEQFLKDVLRFAAPAGAALAAGVLAAYAVALQIGGLAEARTASTTTLLGGLLIVMILLEASSRRRRRSVEALAAAMAAGYILVLASPAARAFFSIVAPTPALLATAGGAIVLTMVLARFGIRAATRVSE